MLDKTVPGNHDYQRGIRAYTMKVMNCRACKRPCNTFWQPRHDDFIPVFACSQECADRVALRWIKQP